MTSEERAVINAAIRLSRPIPLGQSKAILTERIERLCESVEQMKHSLGCACPTDERVYCEASGCNGGGDLPPESEQQHDPLSGDLIPAGQDAELERMGRDMASVPRIEHLAMDREQRRLELEVLEANALHYQAQTDVSAGREPQLINGVQPGAVLRGRVRELALYHGSLIHLEADIDQELSEYRPATEPEIHTASTVATAELSAALVDRELLRIAPDELIWHPRTMRDARKGDQIRPAGSDMPNGTAVTDRYVPATPDASDRNTWHVISAGSGKWAHKDDHVVQPGEVWLCLDGSAPRNVDPDFPIEILLTRAEIAAIELLGWDNREELHGR